MADNRLKELLSLINQQIEFQENINEQLYKAEALTQVALGDNFLDSSKVIAHYYLWILSDIIEQAKIINEKALDVLLKYKPCAVL